MPLTSIVQASFNQGELGFYMDGRADLDVYQRAARTVENFLVLPQGGLQYRRGLEFVNYLDPVTNGNDVRLHVFDFNKQQEYVIVFMDQQIRILRNKSLAATIPVSPYLASELRELRFSQSGDSLFITHPNHLMQILKREGSDTNWSLTELILDPLPFFRFNVTNTLQSNASAVGNGRTFTLDGTVGYWNSGHFGNDILMKVDGGEVTLTIPQQNATGGTALASAGTAASAFDSNNGTITEAGVDGWIGYTYGAATTTRVIGIRTNGDKTLTLALETDDNPSFTTPTLIATASLTTIDDTWLYFDVPVHTGETNFRIRETSGADLSVRDIVLNLGLVAIGNITKALASTTAKKGFTEQAFGEHHGYPRSVSFLGNRLFFGGTRDEPASVFASKDGDVFNFDDTDTKDDNAFSRTLSTDRNHFLRDMKADRDGLALFTSDGTFILDGGGNAITPTNVIVKAQEEIGVYTVPVTKLDGQVVYVSNSGKELVSFSYDFGKDQYVSDSKTTLAHQLFQASNVNQSRPRALAALRNYADTQASLLFIPREDGEMAVLSLDTGKQVLGWARWKSMNPDGSPAKILDAAVVETTHNSAVGAIPTLYVVVERIIDGNTRVFVEALTEEDVYLDHWYTGQNDPAKADWTGLITLPNSTVTVLGDGLVVGDFTVNGSGEFTLTTAVSTIHAGLHYRGLIETMKLPITDRGILVRGRPTKVKQAVVDLYNTLALAINGYPIRFRNFGPDLLDQPLVPFTGQKRIKISNRGSGVQRDPTVQMTVDEPVPCTILTLAVDVEFAD